MIDGDATTGKARVRGKDDDGVGIDIDIESLQSGEDVVAREIEELQICLQRSNAESVALTEP